MADYASLTDPGTVEELANAHWREAALGGKLPRVSFIVLSFQNGPFLAECLQSVDAQTFDDLEIVIGDDGSSDESHSLIRTFVKDARHPVLAVLGKVNWGLVRNYNRCLRATRGAFIFHIASDDLVLPDRVKIQLRALETTNASMCLSGLHVIDHKGKLLRTKAAPELRHTILPTALEGSRISLPSPTMAFRRSLITDFGLLPEHLANEDEALAVRALASDGIVAVPQVTTQYRQHGASLSARARVASIPKFLAYQRRNIPQRIANIAYFESVLDSRDPEAVAGLRRSRFVLDSCMSLLAGAWPQTNGLSALSQLLRLYVYGAVRSLFDNVSRLLSAIAK